MQRDAQFVEATIIIKAECESKLSKVVELLASRNIKVVSVDEDNSVIHAIMEDFQVHAVEQLECVQYVRRVSTWAAEFPKGDPRDRNDCGGECPDALPPEPPNRRMGKRL